MTNDDTKPGFWGWAQKHWFLTFLLAGSALAIPANIISAARAPATPASGPPVPPANPNQGAAAPFKPGDVVIVELSKIRGALSMGANPSGSLPNNVAGPVNVRIDSLDAPNPGIGLDPSSFMGSLVSPITAGSTIWPREAVVGVVSRS